MGMEHKPAYSTSDKSDLAYLHLKLVTKLALFTGLGAIGLLILMAGIVAVEVDGGYFQIIQAHTITRQHIGPAMIVTTLLLLAVVSLSVWLIALFSSFRIAGPLYRFSRIFQQASQSVPVYSLRRNDTLQDVSHDIQQSIEQLHVHYQGLRNEVEALQNILQQTDDNALAQQYQQGLQRLKKLESELQLHE
jgi:sensor histidine kinase YesM